MNEYELTYIKRIGADEAKMEKIEQRVTRAFDEHGGEVLLNQDLGEKTLAYLIEKEGKGHYVRVNFAGSGALVDEIEGLFRISPEILRFLTVRLNRQVNVEQKKKEYAERNVTPASPQGEDGAKQDASATA